MSVDILCSSPYHSDTVGLPGHADIVAQGSQAITGMICEACAAFTPLAQYQAAAVAQVQARTAELLAAGFAWTMANGSGTYNFDASAEIQPTWLGLYLGAANLTYPFGPVGTTTPGVNVQFSSAAEVAQWYAGGVARVSAIMVPGNAIEAAIMAAASNAEVDAALATDTRT